MKKIALAATLAALMSAGSVAAEGWRFLPALEQGMKFEPTLAFTLSRVDPDGWSTETAYGLDFNFNCGLIQDPKNRIRTHFNLTHFDENGLNMTGYELSPRYTLPIGNNLSVGVGPSLALFSVETRNYDEMHFGIGVAAGINYRVGKFYAGADLRIHDTGSKNNGNGNGDVDFDNVTLGAKVGINF